MCVKNNYFICVSEEANLFLSHLNCTMVYRSNLFYCLFEFVGREFYLRVAHLNWAQLVSLRHKFFFLAFKIVQAIRYICSFYLFTAEILNFSRCLLNVLRTKSDQRQVFFKVFLLPIDARFFNFKCIRIFQFDFCLLEENLADYFFKVSINLLHDLYFTLFYVLTEFKPLTN